MALNLISSYGSDDESDCEEEPTSASVDRAAEDEPSTSSSAMLSGECSDSNSDSNTESESDSPVKSESSTLVEEPPMKRRLPSAADVFSTKLKTGVMCNDYERAKLEHEAMLSRHVPLTEPTKKKPICKAFQRGMCKRGKNCRYDHPPNAAPTPDMSKAVLSAPVQYTTANDLNKSRPVLKPHP